VGSCRLNALGVPRTYRYGGATSRTFERPGWSHTALASIVHNPLYKGMGTVQSRYGDVAYAAEPLVDANIWELAQAMTIRNRKLSKKNAKREYHLRGLLRCGLCGLGYVGATNRLGRLYRCQGQTGKASTRQAPCPAGILNAARLEDGIWQEVRAFVDDPGPYVEQAQQQLRERLATTSQNDDQRKRLAADLAGKETERERVLGMFRRGRITSDEAERELDAIASEATQIRDLIESLKTQAQMAEAQEAYLSDAASMLARVRGRVQQIEEENDWAAKRDLIELLVPRMIVRTEITGTTPGGRRRKDTRVALTLAFRSDSAVVSGRQTGGRSTT